MILKSPEVQLLRAYMSVLSSNLRSTRERDEVGAAEISTIVIITAILAAATIAIGAIIVTKFTHKANTIPTE